MGQIGSFAQKVSLVNPRSLHDLVFYNDKVYIIGGTTSATALAAGTVTNIEVARVLGDGSLSSFVKIGDLPAPRSRSDSVVTNQGFIYTLGGQDTTATAQATVYLSQLSSDGNVVVDTTVLPNFPKASMIGHRLTTTGPYLYCICGGATNITDVWYTTINSDGTLGTWKQTSSHPLDLLYPAVVETGNTIYTIGGMTNTGSIVKNDCYKTNVNSDGTLSKWVKCGDLGTSRWRHAAIVTDNNVIFAIGGAQTSVATNAISTKEVAHINSDGSLSPFKPTGPLPANIRNCRTVLNGVNNVYTVGGFDGTNATTTVAKGALQHDGHI